MSVLVCPHCQTAVSEDSRVCRPGHPGLSFSITPPNVVTHPAHDYDYDYVDPDTVLAIGAAELQGAKLAACLGGNSDTGKSDPSSLPALRRAGSQVRASQLE